MYTNYLIAKDPANADLCDYIIRMSPPFTIIAITSMNTQGVVFREDFVCKMYSTDHGNYQLTALQINDGISEFYLDTIETLEWVLDDAWKWYNTISADTILAKNTQ